ncbi:hypothetical protein SAMN05216296_1989 [Pseudomonas pohangensis]|uniref:Uncharacterized protein n=1 Tax=Pseudomonas pohangensis TaxID=364197 RepID=A0A1H2G2N0_9PSED|nr:hypothetical protein [Pseudomonas pohangensis]SDU13785.1 hypothetical protein SAMN05216296_1989 [Pseudomonas pohangensis]
MIYIQKEDLPTASFALDARLYAGQGWLSLVREAMVVIGSSPIHAIREDAGLLRIELGRPTPEQSETIKEIQKRSAQVCEICGEQGSLRFEGLKNGQPAGWHRTRCDEHVDTRTDDLRGKIKAKSWLAVCQDAGDGNGDLLVYLPPDLLAEMGWQAGDTLDFNVLANGTITLSKLGAEKAGESS